MQTEKNSIVARPLSRGIAAAFLLMGGATILLVALSQPHWRAPPPMPAVVKTVAAKPLPQPSPVYALEASMTPNQLIARWNPQIAKAARRFSVSEDWIRAVMRQESGGRTMLGENLPMTSAMGAMGLMQVMPDTYAEMRQQLNLGADPYDPQDNIYAGAAYLKWLHGKYGYPAMFAAYNDGPGNLEGFLDNRRALPAETHSYVQAIARALGTPITGLTEVSLTRPDGSPVAIDATKVSAVHAASPGEYAPGVATVVSIGKSRQGVREDFAKVAALLRSHGAKV